MSIQAQSASGGLGGGGERLANACLSFARELRDPACLVATVSITFLLVSVLSVILFLEHDPIRAYPPKPPTKAQIRAAETIGQTFNPIPPDQRPQKGR